MIRDANVAKGWLLSEQVTEKCCEQLQVKKGAARRTAAASAKAPSGRGRGRLKRPAGADATEPPPSDDIGDGKPDETSVADPGPSKGVKVDEGAKKRPKGRGKKVTQVEDKEDEPKAGTLSETVEIKPEVESTEEAKIAKPPRKGRGKKSKAAVEKTEVPPDEPPAPTRKGRNKTEAQLIKVEDTDTNESRSKVGEQKSKRTRSRSGTKKEAESDPAVAAEAVAKQPSGRRSNRGRLARSTEAAEPSRVEGAVKQEHVVDTEPVSPEKKVVAPVGTSKKKGGRAAKNSEPVGESRAAIDSSRTEATKAKSEEVAEPEVAATTRTVKGRGGRLTRKDVQDKGEAVKQVEVAPPRGRRSREAAAAATSSAPSEDKSTSRTRVKTDKQAEETVQAETSVASPRRARRGEETAVEANKNASKDQTGETEAVQSSVKRKSDDMEEDDDLEEAVPASKKRKPSAKSKRSTATRGSRQSKANSAAATAAGSKRKSDDEPETSDAGSKRTKRNAVQEAESSQGSTRAKRASQKSAPQEPSSSQVCFFSLVAIVFLDMVK